MKRFLALLLALAVSVSLLSACGNDSQQGASTSPGQLPDEEASGGTKKVALLLTSPLGDGGNMDSMNAGLMKAKEAFGVETATYEALESGTYEESIRSFCEEGYDLIMSMWGNMNDQFNTLAGEFPDVNFVMNYSCAYEADHANYTGFDYATYQAAYVCGVASALVSSSGKLGYVAGNEDTTIYSNYNAYVEGAQSVNPDATVAFINANSHQDAAKGKEIAISLYDSGVDVIMCDASTTTLGVIEAAEEYGPGYYCGGDALDHSSYGPGSVFIDTRCSWDESVYTIVDSYLKGELDGSTQNFDYSNGVIGTYKSSIFADNCGDPELAARMDDIWEQVENVEAQIAAGTLEIVFNTTSPNA